ncbi:MAG: putative DNA binding domain-containing protein [Chitinivibrionales bacterium]|nr:putative DNA binding domain-containing protein [Chitinivibrionales bacterium]
MSLILPINIEDLLHCTGVESARIEFKASWDEKTTCYQVLKTICAFANDLQNLNGGYIVIGVEENSGCAILPPKGIAATQIEQIQRWIRGNCHRIDPEYQPVPSPEIVDGRHILVLWAPGSDIRPHKAPDGERAEKKYFVRIGSESVDADKNGVLDQLLQMTARVPFDDRRAQHASIEDIRESRVREFLKDIKSGLIEETNTKELYRKLKIAMPVNGYDMPKNIGLLFFSENPEGWFPGARIEIVQFAADISGNVIEEKTFSGGIHGQLSNALAYLDNISSAHFEKQTHSFRVKGWVSYPIQAVREALVNAVYHRSYEATPEPVKVYLYPDRMEIISYPGPIQGIMQEHLLQHSPMPPVPARNRRIGEFLKELRLAEGRGTGLPKLYRSMRENGSQSPRFDFDDERTYFRVSLPAHPEYVAISALRDAAHLRAIGNDTDAFKRIDDAWKQMKSSPTLAAELIRLLGAKGRLNDAESVFASFKESTSEGFIPFVTNVLIEVLVDSRRESDAKKYLNKLPQYLASSDALESAILARRLGREENAHRYFERAGDILLHDTRALHEFAQTKIVLAQNIFKHRRHHQIPAPYKRLLTEAKELLERVLQMDADKTRHAWAWWDLGRVKKWLKLPASEVKAAYKNAIELLPQESRFKDELRRWEQSSHDKGG